MIQCITLFWIGAGLLVLALIMIAVCARARAAWVEWLPLIPLIVALCFAITAQSMACGV